MAEVALTLEQIVGVLGTTRSKTDAAGYIEAFLRSGELGKEVDLSAGSFAGKEARQVKTSLDNARKKMNEETKELQIPGGLDVQVRISQDTNGKKGKEKVVNAEHLFIINTKLVGEAQAAKAKTEAPKTA